MAAADQDPRRVAARAAAVVPGTVERVAALWLDPTRWSAWRDGLVRVVAVDASWPEPGGEVEWDASSSVRARTRERVVRREPGRVDLDVEDAQLEGTLAVTLHAVNDAHVRINLRLDFRLKERVPLTAIREWLHTRGVLAASLRRSLTRLQRELVADRDLA